MPGDAFVNPDFIFALAHDLRASLRTVLTRIQILQAGGAEKLSSQDRMLLDEASVAAVEMNGLLSAAVAYCDPDVSNETVGLSLLVRGLLLEMKARLGALPASVDLTLADDFPVPAAFRTILKELLTNACRFRRPDQPLQIQISSRLLTGTAEIAVADNGLGVEPAYTEKIFSPFARLHPKGEFAGYGLGLALCRRIAGQFGGHVFASPSVAGGLVVTVQIPLG